MGDTGSWGRDQDDEKEHEASRRHWERHYKLHRDQSNIAQYRNASVTLKDLKDFQSRMSLTEIERQTLKTTINFIEAFLYPHED